MCPDIPRGGSRNLQLKAKASDLAGLRMALSFVFFCFYGEGRPKDGREAKLKERKVRGGGPLYQGLYSKQGRFLPFCPLPTT